MLLGLAAVKYCVCGVCARRLLLLCASLLWKGSQLEERMGTRTFLAMVAFLTLSSSVCFVALGACVFGSAWWTPTHGFALDPDSPLAPCHTSPHVYALVQHKHLCYPGGPLAQPSCWRTWVASLHSCTSALWGSQGPFSA